jgi:putative addiction module killer protein
LIEFGIDALWWRSSAASHVSSETVTSADHKYLRDGVSELRIDEGAGYRVYYAQVEQVMVLLLCGGDKSTQTSDVNRAVASWEEFQRRRKEDGRT